MKMQMRQIEIVQLGEILEYGETPEAEMYYDFFDDVVHGMAGYRAIEEFEMDFDPAALQLEVEGIPLPFYMWDMRAEVLNAIETNYL